jgi:hypothetical protein
MTYTDVWLVPHGACDFKTVGNHVYCKHSKNNSGHCLFEDCPIKVVYPTTPPQSNSSADTQASNKDKVI